MYDEREILKSWCCFVDACSTEIKQQKEVMK